MKHFLFLSALLLALAAPAAFAQSGDAPHNAGFRYILATHDGAPVRIALWYPTAAEERETSLGPFTLRVARGAPPADGSFGLVVISHGSGGGALNHRDTARALARAGFVAAAIHHPGDNWQDGSRTGTTGMWSARPAHLTAAIDTVLEHETFGPLVDRGRIGAMGHSAGGYTVLAAAGARPDLAALTTHCTERAEDDPAFCGYRSDSDPDPDAAVEVEVARESRLRAVAALAPVGQIFSEGSFDGFDAALLLMRGGQDSVLRAPFHAEHIHGLVGREHDYLTLEAAGHFTFIAPFPESLRAVAGPAAEDPEGTDRAAVHERLNRRIVNFFETALD